MGKPALKKWPQNTNFAKEREKRYLNALKRECSIRNNPSEIIFLPNAIASPQGLECMQVRRMRFKQGF
jgi:hypothetical protein